MGECPKMRAEASPGCVGKALVKGVKTRRGTSEKQVDTRDRLQGEMAHWKVLNREEKELEGWSDSEP